VRSSKVLVRSYLLFRIQYTYLERPRQPNSRSPVYHAYPASLVGPSIKSQLSYPKNPSLICPMGFSPIPGSLHSLLQSGFKSWLHTVLAQSTGYWRWVSESVCLLTIQTWKPSLTWILHRWMELGHGWKILGRKLHRLHYGMSWSWVNKWPTRWISGWGSSFGRLWGRLRPLWNITGKLSNKSLPNLRSSQHWQLLLAMVVCNA